MNKIIIACLYISLVTSCTKDFLNEKQNKSQVVPTSIQDLQAILDDATRTINIRSCHELSLIGSDEYYVTDAGWSTLPVSAKPYESRAYYWDRDNVYEGANVRDWDFAYRRILIANTAIAGLEKLKPSTADQQQWNNAMGSALFIRAFDYFRLAQQFCQPYDAGTANDKLGLPLRIKPEIDANVQRSKLFETYKQVIIDLETSAGLLPEKAVVKYRPSQAAAFALLAKTALIMGNYVEAGEYADRSLQIESSLLDFNKLDLNLAYSFPTKMQDNPEILYISYVVNQAILQPARAKISDELYALYGDNDLRKVAYFKANGDGSHAFRGSYFGNATTLFTGLCVDEVLLIRAESQARIGDIMGSATTLSTLLAKRYKSATFAPLVFSSQDEALREIIRQRRKQLILRGVRWEDLRRLNKEARFAMNITRTLNGVKHQLLPGDLRYTWPIPDKAIDLGGYQQNER